MTKSDIFLMALTAILTVVTASLTWSIFVKRLPVSYRIAVIGFPRAGKTTLITAVFAYLFRRGVRGASIVPRGDETIKRINRNMEQLDLGRPIGPTTDQDVFAYRAEIRTGNGLLARHYKLEIGDFPGEDTLEFSKETGDWLHESRYFEWAISSDAFLFVVDVGAVLLDETGEYVARQKRALRAAWQRLEEQHLDSDSNMKYKPLILVFTKSDLLFIEADLSGLKHFAFGAIPRAMADLPQREIGPKTAQVLSRFSELIDYFSRENRRFAFVFASVCLNVDGERLGIPEIARYVMPKPRLWSSVPTNSAARDRSRQDLEDFRRRFRAPFDDD